MSDLEFGAKAVRRTSRTVRIGRVSVGGGAPVSVQSMAKTDTRDREATVSQIRNLESLGCEIVRCAVPDTEAAEALREIRKAVSIPVVADIHFDHRLALRVLEDGIDGLRINPGNIGSRTKVREVARSARERGIPIRIGVNAGSLEKDLLNRFGGPTPEAMVESGLRHVRILEESDFFDIKISLKASDVLRTVRAYELMAEKVDYPFHVGITEAGGMLAGTIKSSVGLGLLLSKGLADTIRVSLTAPPEEEVRVAWLILSSLGLRRRGPEIVSCPTCGRCEVDLMKIATDLEHRLSGIDSPLRLAVMGCMVNGPGEAREADIGLACGRGKGVIFRGGRVLKKVAEDRIVDTIVEEILRLEKKTRK